ncbi:IS66 family insertion sequence element accessory protein TnpB [Desulfobacter hydrogenophilus]|uniref:IS66 family insertion sequence element accessory protein TnpB n=1 Tax=Desulfobacter hydrogenophilus TaxID=2291 RepID=UPI0013D895F9|nr:IS66 family insertion sequence element accessory protein TnpB [Desulfobacter hydrogenophilus]NDY74295.1 IS66 family insertion sequence element accessory protein TnpB [Desulfobacter hydrogenophilus]
MPSDNIKAYLSLGYTDMRKSINGLFILVSEHMELNPFSGNLFVFCNRRQNMIKVLYWDKNGFCLWHKRLEKHFFKWATSQREIIMIGKRELSWLMDGLFIHQAEAHKPLQYSVLY